MFKRTSWRPVAAMAVLLITAALFINYVVEHPELRQQLGRISPGLLIGLLGLYIVAVMTLALINTATLKLCNTKMSARDSLLLTMYSAVINFFGPLQSGPAFRAIYLKQKFGIKLKDYTLASFVYYFFYALFSGLFLLSGWLKWWLLVPVAAVLLAIIYWQRTRGDRTGLALGGWYYMALATFLQVAAITIIYYLELRSIAPGISFGQAVIYAGAANFALFVALTPGAIGFRESFLLFSQRLHHIDSSTIIAANVIDRSVYIILLVMLAIGIFGTHANHRFKARIDSGPETVD